MKTIVIDAAVDATEVKAHPEGEYVMLIPRKIEEVAEDDTRKPLEGGLSALSALSTTVYNPEIFEGAKRAEITIKLFDK